jgi:predicted metal-dependent phosphoesterase TrpH
MRADLHVHSTASDGTVPPGEVVAMAAGREVDVLAITDHDSVEGLAEAQDAATGLGVTLIPAVELSSVHNGVDVHILGYFVDRHDPRLLGILLDLRDARRRRAEAIVAALRDGGFSVTTEDVLRLADGAAIGRSHVARALVKTGHAESVADAFARLIGRGRPFYVAKDSRPPADVVAGLRALGSVPVIAHPGISRAEHLIPELVEAGLMGIEVFHADHDAEQVARFAETARRLGLLVTGGTDFHGLDAPNPMIGSVDVPVEAVRALLACGRTGA